MYVDSYVSLLVGERVFVWILLLLLIAFIERYSPLLTRLTALACDST